VERVTQDMQWLSYGGVGGGVRDWYGGVFVISGD
jgi:hypothetical protein